MSVDQDCKSLEVISLHIPKTGGRAMMSWLEVVYGRDNVYFDYDENPHNVGQPYQSDPQTYLRQFSSGYPFLIGKKAVHGHLWMKKYHRIDDVLRITFLRDPVERLISDYWNEKIFSEGWKRSILENVEPIDVLARKYRKWSRKLRVRHNALQSSFFTNPPSFLEFAEMPLKRNFLSTLYFGDTGPEEYDFIGDHARIDEEIKRLKLILDKAEFPDPPKENVTSISADGYANFKEGIYNDSVMLGRVKDLLAEDIRFYEKYAGK